MIFKIKGIDAIKASLREGLKLSTEDKPVKINLIAPPVYVITSSSLDRDEGVKLLQDVIEKIKASIESFKGRFKVKMAPKVVTDLDEAELARQMEQMEAENEQKLMSGSGSAIIANVDDAANGGDSADAIEAVDPYDLMDPADILSKFPNDVKEKLVCCLF